MKTIIVALLLPLLLYSQEDYETKYKDECRSMTVDALNFMHDHDFKAYPKKDNLVMEIDFNTNCSSSKVNEKTIISMKNNAKETIYSIISKTMPKFIESNDLCQFNFYIFDVIYKSDDYKYYTYTYYVSVTDLYDIKDSLSKKEVFPLLLYKE